MEEDKRPEWKHKMTLPMFEKMWNATITKITHHWKQIGCDSGENWIEFHDGKNNFRAPAHWEEFFKFAPDHRTLIQPAYNAEYAAKDLEAIKKWEKKHQRELSEYKRLKEKFDV